MQRIDGFQTFPDDYRQRQAGSPWSAAFKHCATRGELQDTSHRLPFTVLLHEVNELPELVVVVLPELAELVTPEDVFESTDVELLEFADDELLELTDDELPAFNDDESFDVIALPASPEVVALTVPDFDVIELVAACSDPSQAVDARIPRMAAASTVLTGRPRPLIETFRLNMVFSVRLK